MVSDILRLKDLKRFVFSIFLRSVCRRRMYAQFKDNSKIHQKKVLLLLESPDFSFDGFKISRFA